MSTIFAPRHYSRFQTKYMVHFMGDAFLGRGTIFDMSLGGCRIDGDVTVQAGSPLALRLVVPNRPAPINVDRVKIRWVKGQTFGVEFLAMQPAERTRLSQLIHGLASRHYAASVAD
ncbi:MAG: PilZ domain-containing protein [Nitrospiraceae bacterium]